VKGRKNRRIEENWKEDRKRNHLASIGESGMKAHQGSLVKSKRILGEDGSRTVAKATCFYAKAGGSFPKRIGLRAEQREKHITGEDTGICRTAT